MIWCGSSFGPRVLGPGGFLLIVTMTVSSQRASRLGRLLLTLVRGLLLAGRPQLLQGRPRQEQPLGPQHAVGVELRGRLHLHAADVAGRLVNLLLLLRAQPRRADQAG